MARLRSEQANSGAPRGGRLNNGAHKRREKPKRILVHLNPVRGSGLRFIRFGRCSRKTNQPRKARCQPQSVSQSGGWRVPKLRRGDPSDLPYNVANGSLQVVEQLRREERLSEKGIMALKGITTQTPGSNKINKTRTSSFKKKKGYTQVFQA